MKGQGLSVSPLAPLGPGDQARPEVHCFALVLLLLQEPSWVPASCGPAERPISRDPQAALVVPHRPSTSRGVGGGGATGRGRPRSVTAGHGVPGDSAEAADDRFPVFPCSEVSLHCSSWSADSLREDRIGVQLPIAEFPSTALSEPAITRINPENHPGHDRVPTRTQRVNGNAQRGCDPVGNSP